MINIYRARLNSPIYEEYVAYCNEREFSIDNAFGSIEYEDFCKLLDDAQKYLSETQRKVFTMSKLEQLSRAEISQMLSISEKTVKNQLSLSLKISREKVKKSLLMVDIVFNNLNSRVF